MNSNDQDELPTSRSPPRSFDKKTYGTTNGKPAPHTGSGAARHGGFDRHSGGHTDSARKIKQSLGGVDATRDRDDMLLGEQDARQDVNDRTEDVGKRLGADDA